MICISRRKVIYVRDNVSGNFLDGVDEIGRLFRNFAFCGRCLALTTLTSSIYSSCISLWVHTNPARSSF